MPQSSGKFIGSVLATGHSVSKRRSVLKQSPVNHPVRHPGLGMVEPSMLGIVGKHVASLPMRRTVPLKAARFTWGKRQENIDQRRLWKV